MFFIIIITGTKQRTEYIDRNCSNITDLIAFSSNGNIYKWIIVYKDTGIFGATKESYSSLVSESCS